jgi:hypothetical protein
LPWISLDILLRDATHGASGPAHYLSAAVIQWDFHCQLRDFGRRQSALPKFRITPPLDLMRQDRTHVGSKDNLLMRRHLEHFLCQQQRSAVRMFCLVLP